MSISWNRSLKTGLATAGVAATFAAIIPATASADIVDDALAKIPAGQISCEQANQYWTTEAEYNSYASQAAAVAPFHPRGGEINDALARIDEAADRCGLKGGGAAVEQQDAGAQENTPAPAADTTPAAGDNAGDAPAEQDNTGQETAPAPAENTAEETPAQNGPVFTIPVPEGTPTTTVELEDVGTVVVPDVEKLIEDLQTGNPLAQLAVGSSN
ncbi:hypothetical protein [Corynebacterium halotolerans]|uniref:hypothetical protein n=1 Tax=Corynebacterium halotolerans TaxID=225326 RepID=UPI003CEFA594